MSSESQQNRVWSCRLQLIWIATGIGLLALLTGLTLVSDEFEYGGNQLARPLPLTVALLSGAGAVYLLAAIVSGRTPNFRPMLGWIFAVGLSARALFLFSTPICETDFYRYLWDGGMVASGHNPFGYIPSEIAEGVGPTPIVELGKESGRVLKRVNHPELATIYPATCQAAFAIAHWWKPWSLTAWRLVLLLFDVATLALLALLLRKLSLPMAGLAIYWWNPLLIKETVNSAHMDVVILPFLLVALLLVLNERYKTAMAALACAVGAKVWPVLLLPLLLRPLLKKPRQLMSALLVFAAVLGVLFSPLLAAVKLGGRSGFVAYGEQWDMNSALFIVFVKLAEVPTWLGMELGVTAERLLSRGMAAVVLLAVVAWRVWRPAVSHRHLVTSAMVIVASLFMLSPTQFPWYFTWLLPLLALRPSYALLLLTVMLPLYYLRFYFRARDNVDVFDYGIVWLEFVPVWGLLAFEAWRVRRNTIEKADAVE